MKEFSCHESAIQRDPGNSAGRHSGRHAPRRRHTGSDSRRRHRRRRVHEPSFSAQVVVVGRNLLSDASPKRGEAEDPVSRSCDDHSSDQAVARQSLRKTGTPRRRRTADTTAPSAAKTFFTRYRPDTCLT